MRTIDADKWSDPTAREQLRDCYGRLKVALLPEGGTAGTLVTKVMLGVWGAVPAYDTYFQRAFRSLADGKKEAAAFRTFGERSLNLLAEFYERHAAEIDRLAGELRTRDFTTFDWTNRSIPRSKVIDMFGFQYSTMPSETARAS